MLHSPFLIGLQSLISINFLRVGHTVVLAGNRLLVAVVTDVYKAGVSDSSDKCASQHATFIFTGRPLY